MTKIFFFSLSFSLLAGCGGGTTATDSNNRPRLPDDVEPGISVTGSLRAENDAPLADVSVCAWSAHDAAAPPLGCTTSATDGSWSLSGIYTQVVVTFDSPDFEGELRALTIPEGNVDVGETRLTPVSNDATFLGSPSDATLGKIEFFVDARSAEKPANVSVALVDAYGHGFSPVYAPTDPTHGGFANLESAEYMLVFGSDAGCSVTSTDGFAILDGVTNAAILDVPVREGYVTTAIRVTCQ